MPSITPEADEAWEVVSKLQRWQSLRRALATVFPIISNTRTEGQGEVDRTWPSDAGQVYKVNLCFLGNFLACGRPAIGRNMSRDGGQVSLVECYLGWSPKKSP